MVANLGVKGQERNVWPTRLELDISKTSGKDKIAFSGDVCFSMGIKQDFVGRFTSASTASTSIFNTK